MCIRYVIVLGTLHILFGIGLTNKLQNVTASRKIGHDAGGSNLR